MPTVECVLTGKIGRRSPVEVLSIHAVIAFAAYLVAIASTAGGELLGAAFGFHQPRLGGLRWFCNDVDDAVDRVSAPKSCPRAADHFDPVDILERNVLNVPIHAGEQRRI